MDLTRHESQHRGLWEAMPSLAAILTWVLQIPVEKWLAYLGLLFLLLQMVGYLWRLRRDMRREEERQLSRLPEEHAGDTE